jgi:hypothetical protein
LEVLVRKWRIRSAGTLALVSGAVALAGCGSSSPKVSSSAFISKCTGDSQIKAAVKGDAAKLNSLCMCVQKKLVAGGFGNRTIDDSSTDVANASREAGSACAVQVLTG